MHTPPKKIFIIILLVFISGRAESIFSNFQTLTHDTSLIEHLDSLFLSDQKVFVAQRAGPQNIYVGGVMETFSLQIEQVLSLVQNYRQYTRYFSLAKEVTPAGDSTDWAAKRYYVELGTWSIPARIWSIVRVDDLQATDHGTALLFFEKVESDTLHQKWMEKNEKRHRVLDAKEFMGYWAVDSISKDRVRIAFVAMMDPGFYVPGWLMRFAWRVMLPKLLKDIQQTLEHEKSDFLQSSPE